MEEPISNSKRANRFLVKLPDIFGIEPFFIKKFEGPKLNINIATFLGVRILSSQKWDSITLEVWDPEDGSIGRKIMEMFEIDVHYGFDFTIEILSKTGLVSEEWKFENCCIESVNFGHFDITSDDPTLITIEIHPTNVILLL